MGRTRLWRSKLWLRGEESQRGAVDWPPHAQPHGDIPRVSHDPDFRIRSHASSALIGPRCARGLSPTRGRVLPPPEPGTSHTGLCKPSNSTPGRITETITDLTSIMKMVLTPRLPKSYRRSPGDPRSHFEPRWAASWEASTLPGPGNLAEGRL